MNGLFTVCQKQTPPASHPGELLDKGLRALSHRGTDAHPPISLDNRLQPAPADSATVIAGACSPAGSASCIARQGNNILLFDGRLINKHALCRQLSLPPGNHTDAEVALQLIERRRRRDSASMPAALRALQGFWALVYMDAGAQAIYGARDHFGNRPLSFCCTDNQFAAASESRTLYSLFNDARRINGNAVTDFLLWGDIGKADQYFFTDVRSLEPSHYFKYEPENDLLTVERYYALPYSHSSEPYEQSKENQYADKLRSLIADSVHASLQLFDGAAAIGVSGGMDSSSLICLAKQTNPQKTIVAYTTTDEYDGGEARWAEKVVKHTGAEWIKIPCTAEDLAAKLDGVNRAHSAPVYNASSAVQYFIMEKIREQGQAVFIDGQGGDEMLGGYPAYFPIHLQSLRREWLVREWWNEISKVSNTGLTIREMIMRRLKLLAKNWYYTPKRLALHDKQRKLYCDGVMPEVRNAFWAAGSPLPSIKKSLLNDALFESYTVFLGNILRWGEHSAAALGLDCITPLSNCPELAEYAFSIPSFYKIHNGWNKYIMRKAMVGIVPDEICWRREKKGFYIPEQRWLDNQTLTGDMLRVINAMDDPSGCINMPYVRQSIKKYYTPRNPLFQRFIFRCYSYLLWVNGL